MKLNKDKLLGFVWMSVCGLLLVMYSAWLWGDYIATRIALSPCDSASPSSWCPFEFVTWFNPLGLPWEAAIIFPIYVVILAIGLVIAWIGVAMITKKEEDLAIEEEETGTAGGEDTGKPGRHQHDTHQGGGKQ